MVGKIKQLVKEELNKANENFSQFNSDHEAYAVLLEEIEEAFEDMSYCNGSVERIWRLGVKKNDIERIEDELKVIEEYSLKAIEELIQVAAMVQKFKDYLNNEQK
jgi:hypothetical protein